MSKIITVINPCKAQVFSHKGNSGVVKEIESPVELDGDRVIRNVRKNSDSVKVMFGKEILLVPKDKVSVYVTGDDLEGDEYIIEDIL